MIDMLLQPITQLPFEGIEALAAAARGEGFRFLDRLIDDWQPGANRFDAPGEILLGAFSGSRLVGVGGLNRDPYANEAKVGRIRRLYVAPDFRRQGAASLLVGRLVDIGRAHYEVLRLRVPNAAAAAFYEALGFTPIEEQDATHFLRFA